MYKIKNQRVLRNFACKSNPHIVYDADPNECGCPRCIEFSRTFDLLKIFKKLKRKAIYA